ncbi:MAG: primosomal protein N' [Hungatella sp.]|nr:primosomal protein N' [Hungatella sp.]
MYADIIIDISHEKVDRTFQYRVPESLADRIQVGTQVEIPFGAGNHVRKGYVVGLGEKAEFDPGRIKDIAGIAARGVTAQSRLISLAWWMKERYGSTMNQALKTVLPVKQKIRQKETRLIRRLISADEAKEAAAEAGRKHFSARQRLLLALADTEEIPWQVAANQMNVTLSTVKPMVEKKMIALESETVLRNPEIGGEKQGVRVALNGQQTRIVSDFADRYDKGVREVSLVYGITGSGKTEVYMEIIDHVLKRGRQVVVLIPEIALTYQTVMRFYRRFGGQVSIINSRMSAGERYDQFQRAEDGQVRIMIGPRSALFTPFSDLGLIIMDEEHETAYKSETSPRYHAREVAVHLASMTGASVVLGSATPSLEAYTRALRGEYRLYTLSVRARPESRMAAVQVIDLREELKSGNKSIFSRRLQEAMVQRLESGQQIMLFMNRRGYASFMSCRSCGEAIRCPHCDVTLTLHFGQKLVCHYCGHESPVPQRCPSCTSPYIAGFGTGTQKIEELTRKMFPRARVLRMDMDTTSKKGGHEEILSAFAQGQADILIGTQMIVKGHDFPNVTLVGVLAADLSLYTSDFRCGERTFQLLTQAAGRAGRDELSGEVLIQTYNPEHYSISCAAGQDYESFYRQEMVYREVLRYPPVCQLLAVFASSGVEEELNRAMEDLKTWVTEWTGDGELQLIGPAQATIYKVNDIYRKILYLKHENYDILIQLKNNMENRCRQAGWHGQVAVQYDFA